MYVMLEPFFLVENSIFPKLLRVPAYKGGLPSQAVTSFLDMSDSWEGDDASFKHFAYVISEI